MTRKNRRNYRKVVINDSTRLFIQKNTIGCVPDYDYHSCIAMGDIDLPKAEKEIQYCPDPNSFNNFVALTSITGERELGTSNLFTNFTSNRSQLKKYYDMSCPFKMQVHVGYCEKANEFSKFDKALLFSGVEVTNYNIATPMTNTAADREVVTETLDFSFFDLIEVSKPTFYLHEEAIIGDGPIIDSYTFCGDDTCSLCEGNIGRYFIQLVQCEDDCVKLRVVYTKDDITWNVRNIETCNTLEAELQLINTNIAFYNNIYYTIGIESLYKKKLYDVIDNSIHKLNKTLLYGNRILKSITKNNITVFIGEDGRLFIEKDGILTRITNRDISPHDDLLSISTLDGYNFVIGSASGKVYTINLDNQASYVSVPNGNSVHQVIAISECSFGVSNGINGGLIYSNGRMEKMKYIYGAITGFAFYNEDIGYASTVSASGVRFWQTVDGGQSWQELEQYLDTNYVVNTISICPYDHNIISIAGRKMATAIPIDDHINPLLTWDGLGTGFAFIAK